MEVDVRIFFLLTSLLCVCECRHEHKHLHNKRLHPGFPPLPLPPHVRSPQHFEDITSHSSQIDEDTRVKLFNLKRKLPSEHEIAQHKTDSHKTVVPKTTKPEHMTTRSVTQKPVTKHSNAASTKAQPTSTIPTTKPTSKHQVSHHATVTTTASPLEQSKKLSNDIHTKLNNLGLKVAVANIESDLQKLLDAVSDVDDNVQQSSSVATTTPFTGTTTIGTQTTPKPFPGQYQGYIPVTKATPKQPPSDRNKQEIPRNADDGDLGKRSLKVFNSHHEGTKPLHPNTPGEHTQRTHTHNVVLKSLSKMNTDLLTGMLAMKASLRSLNINLRRALNSINDVSADNTNEERTDIKVNSDRIAQLQQGLEGKIDDLRYNISNLITSQRELAKSMTWSLEKMMGMLTEMVDDVTGNDMKPGDTFRHVTAPVSSTAKVQAVTKHATTTNSNTVDAVTKHTTASHKVAQTTLTPNTIQSRQSNKRAIQEPSNAIDDIVKRYNDHSIVNRFKNHRGAFVNKHTHDGNTSKHEYKPTHVQSKRQHPQKKKQLHSSTNHPHAAKISDIHSRNSRSFHSCWRKCRSSGTRKHDCVRMCRHQK